MKRSNITRVIIEFAKVTPAGTLYRVSREDGSVLIAATTDPEHVACRALLAEGVRGKLITRWAGAKHDSLTMGIEWGAKRATVESATRPLCTVLWEPFDTSRRPTASMLPPKAVSRDRHSPPAAGAFRRDGWDRGRGSRGDVGQSRKRP